jgi:hypothetical protein
MGIAWRRQISTPLLLGTQRIGRVYFIGNILERGGSVSFCSKTGFDGLASGLKSDRARRAGVRGTAAGMFPVSRWKKNVKGKAILVVYQDLNPILKWKCPGDGGAEAGARWLDCVLAAGLDSQGFGLLRINREAEDKPAGKEPASEPGGRLENPEQT